jgi:transposase
MSFIRYQKYGNIEYAYEITAYWDSDKKMSRQKTRYLGMVVDKSKKIFEKKNLDKNRERLILDFGDSYCAGQFLQNSGYVKLVKEVFGDFGDTVMALLLYRLCYNGAMMYANRWFEGNYAKFMYKDADLSSQRISDFLKGVGDEKLQRSFFARYLKEFVETDRSIIIDATSLPNQIHIPLTEWGLHGEDIDKQMRFLLVVDKTTFYPIYFRILPGNIVDVSTLRGTIDELKKYGIKNSFTYMDAGFFSEENIKEMQTAEINFLTRLPAGRILYKELIKNEIDDLEERKNIVRYGKRALFVKKVAIDLFGRKAFAYIVLDPQRKGRELNRLMLETIDEKDNPENIELDYEFSTRGIMILVSSYEIPKDDVVPTYYVRQTVEMLFGFSKDDIGILPLRVHSEASVRGFLFMQFITLIGFMQLKKKLGKDYTVEEALVTMRNLKCKVYDKEIVVSELTKAQREISESLGILVSKNLGI